MGGLDNIDGALFAPFDYTALGHIHSPQKITGAEARYCGSPLKYSFSEAGQQKSVLLVDMREKGDLEIREIPLKPLREMREIRGSYDELTSRKNYENTDTEAYIHVTLDVYKRQEESGDADAEDTETDTEESSGGQVILIAAGTITDESIISGLPVANLDFYMNCLGSLCGDEESAGNISIDAKSVDAEYLTVTAIDVYKRQPARWPT